MSSRDPSHQLRLSHLLLGVTAICVALFLFRHAMDSRDPTICAAAVAVLGAAICLPFLIPPSVGRLHYAFTFLAWWIVPAWILTCNFILHPVDFVFHSPTVVKRLLFPTTVAAVACGALHYSDKERGRTLLFIFVGCIPLVVSVLMGGFQ